MGESPECVRRRWPVTIVRFWDPAPTLHETLQNIAARPVALDRPTPEPGQPQRFGFGTTGRISESSEREYNRHFEPHGWRVARDPDGGRQQLGGLDTLRIEPIEEGGKEP